MGMLVLQLLILSLSFLSILFSPWVTILFLLLCISAIDHFPTSPRQWPTRGILLTSIDIISLP